MVVKIAEPAYNPLLYTWAYEAQTEYHNWTERLNTMYEVNYKIFSMVKTMVKNDIHNARIGGIYEPIEPIRGVVDRENIDIIHENLDRLMKSNYEVYMAAWELLFKNTLKKDLIDLFAGHTSHAGYGEANIEMKKFNDELTQFRKIFNDAWKVFYDMNAQVDYIMQDGQKSIDSYVEALTASGLFVASVTREQVASANVAVLEMVSRLQETLAELNLTKNAVITVIHSINTIEDEIVPKMIELLNKKE